MWSNFLRHGSDRRARGCGLSALSVLHPAKSADNREGEAECSTGFVVQKTTALEGVR
jgi:hypothetical protein